MIQTITESKQVYPEFKFFKSIYTTLNIAESIIMIPQKNNIFLLFSKDSQYYNLQGTLEGNTIFFNWLKTIDSCKITLSEINILGKCLKKNAISIEYEDKHYFSFKYIEKDTEIEKEIKIFNNLNENYSLDIEKFKDDNFEFVYTLSDNFTKSEICTVFRDNNEITTSRSKDKIIEIPSARIKSIIKNGENKIFVSDRNIDGNRFIKIKSTNKDLNLSLEQIFKTI